MSWVPCSSWQPCSSSSFSPTMRRSRAWGRAWWGSWMTCTTLRACRQPWQTLGRWVQARVGLLRCLPAAVTRLGVWPRLRATPSAPGRMAQRGQPAGGCNLSHPGAPLHTGSHPAAPPPAAVPGAAAPPCCCAFHTAAALLLLLQAVSTVTEVLALCVKAGKYIETQQLYKAYRVLDTIQRDHGAVLLRAASDPRLPPPVAADGGAVGSMGPGRVAPPPSAGRGASSGGGAAGLAANLGPLAAYLRDRVRELTGALEQRALGEFNNWLVSVRSQARTIGMHAIRRAAAERQQDELLGKQRRALLQQLPAARSVAEAAALVAAAMRVAGLTAAPPLTPLALQEGHAAPGQQVAAAAAGEESAPGSRSPRGGGSPPAAAAGRGSSRVPSPRAARGGGGRSSSPSTEQGGADGRRRSPRPGGGVREAGGTNRGRQQQPQQQPAPATPQATDLSQATGAGGQVHPRHAGIAPAHSICCRRRPSVPLHLLCWPGALPARPPACLPTVN